MVTRTLLIVVFYVYRLYYHIRIYLISLLSLIVFKIRTSLEGLLAVINGIAEDVQGQNM